MNFSLIEDHAMTPPEPQDTEEPVQCGGCGNDSDGMDGDGNCLCEDCAYSQGLIFCGKCETYRPMATDDVDGDCIDCIISLADLQ